MKIGFCITILFAMISFVMIVFADSSRKVCTQESRITQIGGCNGDGYCGVTTESGHKELALLPVLGEKICIKQMKDK